MQEKLLIAILAGSGGMLGWGVADFFAKKTIDRVGDVTTLFWNQFFGVVPLLVLFAYKPSMPLLGVLEWLYLIILGAWSGLSYIPTYVAFGKGKVSLLSPIFATYAVVVTILSALFLGESIPIARWAAFLVVFIGILLINGDPRDIWAVIRGGQRNEANNVKGLKEILTAVCLYSVWLVALDRFLNGRDWVPILLVIRIFSAVSLFFYGRFTNRKLVITDKSLWKFLFLIGVFDVAAFGFVSWGFSATPFVSVVAMLSGAFSLPTILLARVFLKEKTTRVQMIGSLIIVLGIALLYLLK